MATTAARRDEDSSSDISDEYDSRDESDSPDVARASTSHNQPLPRRRQNHQVTDDDEEDGEDEELDRRGVKWTPQLEARLQMSWSRDDQILLGRSHKHNEDPLWATCEILYGLPPPEILPQGVFVDTTNNSTIETQDGRLLTNTNWSQNMCVELSKVVKYTAFYRDLPFLKHVLKFVLFLRCGDEGEEKPKPPNCSNDLAGEILRQLGQMLEDEDILEKLGEALPKVQEQIESRYGDEDHPHVGLLDSLEKIVKRGYHKNTPGLTLKDLKWISKAWSSYAESKALPKTTKIDLYRKGALPKDKKRREQALKIRAFDLEDAKKSYILALRREVWRINGKWIRGVHDLYGEALEPGKDYAVSWNLPTEQMWDGDFNEGSDSHGRRGDENDEDDGGFDGGYNGGDDGDDGGYDEGDDREDHRGDDGEDDVSDGSFYSCRSVDYRGSVQSRGSVHPCGSVHFSPGSVHTNGSVAPLKRPASFGPQEPASKRPRMP